MNFTPDHTAAELTVFHKHGGVLSKRISLEEDGSVRSDGSACVMSSGEARRAPVIGAHGLADLIATLDASQALALGRLREDLPDRVDIVSKRKLNGSAAIARTADYIKFENGKLSWALIDYDLKGMPVEVSNRLKEAGGFWPALRTILPELGNTARVYRYSTSAGLYRSDNGEALKGSAGRHLYILIGDGSDTERFLHDLHNRAWLCGFGWLMIGKGGQFLERSIVDRVVGTPERLVFEGPPTLEYPIAQHIERRQPIAYDGDVLDTVVACPPLRVVEKQQLSQLIAQEKHKLAPESAQERDRFVEEQTQKLVARGISHAAATETILTWTKGVLLPSVELPFDDEELAGKTIADVLADPARFVGQTMADPLEGIEYGPCKAKIMRRGDGSIWIHSFAHGRKFYDALHDYQNIMKLLEATPDDGLVNVLARLVTVSALKDHERDALRDYVADRTGTGKRAIDKTLKFAQNEQICQLTKDMEAQRLALRRDKRQRMPVPHEDSPWLPQMEVINDVISAVKLTHPRGRDIDGVCSRVRIAVIPGTHAFRDGN